MQNNACISYHPGNLQDLAYGLMGLAVRGRYCYDLFPELRLLGFRGEETQRGRTTPTWCGGRLQTDGVNTCKLRVFVSHSARARSVPRHSNAPHRLQSQNINTPPRAVWSPGHLLELRTQILRHLLLQHLPMWPYHASRKGNHSDSGLYRHNCNR
jgi:hypothetical protein